MRDRVRRLRRRVIAIPIILGAMLAVGVLVSTSDLLGDALPWARPATAIGEGVASTTAIEKLGDLRPDIKGWRQDAIEHKTLTEVRDLNGNVSARFDEALDAWLVRLSAPAQGGYTNNVATVVIDAESGEVRSASVDGWNR